MLPWFAVSMMWRDPEGHPSWAMLSLTLGIVVILGLLSAWACLVLL